jgi:hypothetical protein
MFDDILRRLSARPDNTLHDPQTPQHTTGDSTTRSEPIISPPLKLVDLTHNTSSPAYLLETPLAERLRDRLPARLHIAEYWRLVYSLDRDGASLATLYQKCGQFRDEMWGYVLVVKDDEGCVCMPIADYDKSSPAVWCIPLRISTPSACFLWQR